MEKEKLESLLIDYIDGNLNDTEIQVVEKQLLENPEASKLYSQLKEVLGVMDRPASLHPSASLKISFDKILKEEISTSTKTKVAFLTPAFYRVAAAIALLILGGGTGYWISKYQKQQDEIARLKEEMELTKQMIISKLGNEFSASQRIQGVNVALTITQADDEVVNALVKAMNEDPNTNVRLAALEALSKFHEEPAVRKILVASLAKQTDPVVQIALIQLMVTMKEKGVVRDLERIIDNDTTIKAVKDEAYSGILKLS
ncbi:MAG TPA: HEAT repeat domain-containing protein [Ohtaekwangia sp.]